VRPWAYQLKDASSLHLANWAQAGFGKRAPAAAGDKAEAVWNLVDGDVLVWRKRPAQAKAVEEGDGNRVVERGITIRVA